MNDDLISRQAAKDMIKNHKSDFSTEKDYRTARACVNAVPPAQPVIVPCDYAKACNKVAMNRITSAVVYMEILEDFKEYGYVLVDMRGSTE